jgi:hypothetical protein
MQFVNHTSLFVKLGLCTSFTVPDAGYHLRRSVIGFSTKERLMLDYDHRLFVGVKISSKLRNELERVAPGADRYFDKKSTAYLDVITRGEEKLIGRYLYLKLTDGFPAADINNVSRNICSILTSITSGQRIEENSVYMYIV